MSLVITSNIDKDNPNNQGGINLPYSYTNSMDNLKIPANSEIAVQSVKVNRDQSIALKGNQVFACAFNKPIDSYSEQFGTGTAVVPFNPVEDSLDRIAFPINGFLRNQLGETSGNYLPRDLKTIMNKSMDFATFPPMFKKGSLNSSGVSVSSAVSTNGEVIFTYNFNSVLNASLSNNASQLAGNAITTNKDGANDALYTTVLNNSASGSTLVVSNTTQNTADDATKQRPTIFKALALSNAGGEWTIDLTNSTDGSNSHTDTEGKLAQQWSIGLTRPQLQRPFMETLSSDPSVYYLAPPWFEEYQESTQGTGLGADLTNQYWDWVVKNEYNPTTGDNELEIYHTVADHDDEPQKIQTTRVNYQTGLGTDGDSNFRMGNPAFGINGSSITGLKFKVSNEVMEITFTANAGANTHTISSNQYSGTNGGVAYSGTKASHMLKPVNQNCWNLYPKVMLAPFKLGASPGNASAKNTITFTKYDGYTLNTPQGSTAIYDGIVFESSGRPNYYFPDSELGYENDTLTLAYSDYACFYLHALYSDLPEDRTNLSQLIDTNNISQFIGSDSTKLLEWNPGWKGLANDTLDDLPALILEYSTEAQNTALQEGYGALVNPFLNAQDIFGFSRPIVDNFTPSSALGLRNFTIEADKTNRELPAVANFVRVKNLTHQTFNMANKGFSKILYCIPRFDNTGSDVGNLFFEANEKTYVKLNNTTEINVNSLDVDLVNSLEQIATNYVGQTVVIFHIRQSKN